MKNGKNGGRGALKGIIEALGHASSLYCLGVVSLLNSEYYHGLLLQTSLIGRTKSEKPVTGEPFFLFKENPLMTAREKTPTAIVP